MASDDPLLHPDLISLGRRLRRQLETVLDAERRAAAAMARRQQSLRDRMLDAEDRGLRVVVTCSDGGSVAGSLQSVGLDHVAVVTGTSETLVALAQVVRVEVGR